MELGEELPHVTPRQLDTLAWIVRFWWAHRYAPTHREVATGIGARPGSTAAQRVIDALLDKGYLERSAPGAHRNIRPTSKALEKLKFEGVVKDQEADNGQPDLFRQA